jgi:hypothetical protein
MDDWNLAGVKISEVQDLIDKEQNRRFEHFKLLSTTWGSTVLTISLLAVGICCSCCCCKCCQQCAFWFRDKWTPKECLRHTKEKCVTTNINADRLSDHEVLPSPPSTPVSTRSLPLPIKEPPHPRYRKVNTRRSAVKVSGSMELVEFRNPKTKERKGER